jgi:hypothetical protein
VCIDVYFPPFWAYVGGINLSIMTGNNISRGLTRSPEQSQGFAHAQTQECKNRKQSIFGFVVCLMAVTMFLTDSNSKHHQTRDPKL